MLREYGVRPPGYRLPEATHIGRVRLQVSDLARSVEYYLRVIGLRLIDRQPDRAVLGADDVGLLELRERRGATPVPPHGRLGLYHFAILVPTREDLARFLFHLGQESVRVATADHAVSEALYLWDPDGLGIEVYADRPRTDWHTRGRELVMGTEPLDVRGLLRLAGDGPWTGLPAGTIVGHIHLHVGDLQRAEALYHSALGFDEVVWSYPGALFLSAGGYHHHLGTNIWAAGAPPAADDDARLLEWELVLPSADDVDAAAESVMRAGYSAVVDGRDRLVADDWGTHVRLTAR